ncbi:MAG: outer membrane beta-barrel protein [Bacteroidales bacterium]|nr:outer membrane beta-barrel protein [Bacteroidales bacterium]
MKRFLAFITSAICLTVNVFAARQNMTELRGTVVDATGAPAGFATAYLSNTDGAVVCGTSADAEGRFTLKAAQGTYTFTVSLVGYRDAVQAVTLQCTLLELPPVRLEEDSQLLGEAVVQAVMPKTKLTGEGLATSVHGSVLENAGTANDVLGKVPGLIKGQDGLEVIGKGAPQIYINGRKLTDPSELDRILSHEIQSVEVINNPGAQYDATVRAVVRIRTIKRQGEGFGFNVNLVDEQSLRVQEFNDPDAAVNVNYRTGGVDIFGGVNYNRFSQRQNSDLVQEANLNPVIRQIETLTGDFINQSLTVNGGVNWQIANNHSAGFKVDWGRSLDYDDYTLMEGDIFRGSEWIDHLKTVNRGQNGPEAPQSLGANVYYNGLAGKMGIDLNLDYYQVSNNQISNIQEDSEIQDATVFTESGSDSKLYAAKLVLSYPIWRGQLQVGTEETFSRTRDNYRLNGADIPASSSRVKEDNAAAFVNYGFVVGQIGQLSAGLRFEHVEYAFDDLLGDDDYSRKYNNFFPSVSFAGAFGPVQTMLSYSARTARPGFSMLSSAIRYNNRYTLQSGNAALQPQSIQSLSATALWNFLTLSVSYDRRKEPIITWANLYNEDGVILLKPVNGENPLRSLTAFLVATPTIGPWNISATTGFQKTWLKVGDLVFNDAPIWIAQLNNTLTLKKGWQLELGGEYHSPGQQQNITLTNHYFDLTAAVQKTLLKDGSLVLRLEGRDLTYMGHNNVFTNLGHYNITQSVLMDTQRLVLSIRYRFNSAASKYKGTGAGQDARQRMGSSSN